VSTILYFAFTNILIHNQISTIIAAVIKTVQTRVLVASDSNPTIATVTYDRWLFIETYLVIVSTSIPSIRSIFRSIDGGKLNRRNIHKLSSYYLVSFLHISRRRRELSTEGKRIIDVSVGNVSNEDFVRRGSYYKRTKAGV